MTNAIRLLNGGVLEVRTGVLQGIGPVGPPGSMGLTGPEGIQGATGETGPPGAILQYYSKASVSSSVSVATNTDTLVPFASVVDDDLSVFASTTNMTFTGTGDYQISAWVKFELPADAGDSIRGLWLNSSVGGILVRTGVLAVADEPTYVGFSWAHRTTSGEVLNVYARHSDNLSVAISAGAVSLVKIGAGPEGPPGPTGDTGAVGAVGPVGPTGATGSAGTGYATYADLLP